jgi:hypothetical protein
MHPLLRFIAHFDTHFTLAEFKTAAVGPNSFGKTADLRSRPPVDLADRHGRGNLVSGAYRSVRVGHFAGETGIGYPGNTALRSER